jgi:hypothetical protein
MSHSAPSRQVHAELVSQVKRLEAHMKDMQVSPVTCRSSFLHSQHASICARSCAMQDVEFTIQDGKLYILQVRG